MSQPVFNDEMRQTSRKRYSDIWQTAKLGGQLEGEDAQLAQVMRDHPEYYDIWESTTELPMEQTTLDEGDPFAHVVVHTVIESQLAQNDPPEVRLVLKYKTSHHVPRHQAIHEIAYVFVQHLWKTLHDKTPFDNDAYRQDLNQLLPRSRRTHK
jgi:hypothetical protein